MKRGITTIEALRERCVVDPCTHCWLWQGGCTTDGTPRIHTVDYERMTKATMSGPRAAWNIAHGESPPAWALVFRGCQRRLCLNPAHLRLARSKAEIGAHIRLAGTRKGTAVEARRANVRIAALASGKVYTDPDVVRAIRHAPPEATSVSLAAIYGLAQQTVSRIRRGESHRGIA